MAAYVLNDGGRERVRIHFFPNYKSWVVSGALRTERNWS